MRIPASRFSVLPEGCPVLWGDTPATVKSRRGVAEYRIEIPGRPHAAPAAAHESQLVVDLSTPAAIRAFAPELICAVRGLPAPPLRPPAPLWHEERAAYVLFVAAYESGAWSADTVLPFFKGEEPVTGSTPAECLTNGLKAALDAAKDAQ